MTDYSQGKIYMLISEQTSDIYIGSTVQKLSDRFDDHKKDYKLWLNKKQHYITSYELCKYDDCKIHHIEDYPCESKKQLDRREGEYQKMMDCVNKNIAGRTQKERSDEYYSRPEIKEKVKKYHKEYYSNPEVKEKVKQYRKEYFSRPEVKEKQKEINERRRRIRIKCVCGSEHRKADTSIHKKTKKHIKYIKEMEEKADANNLNEFFDQFKFKLTAN